MPDVTDQEYDALAARLTDPNTPIPPPREVQSGAAAGSEGHAFLTREYGSQDGISAAMQRGRPRVGDTRRGPSPTVRGRISDADYAAFKELERVTGRTQSELVREAVHRLLAHHKLVG